jgi:hypothetical protein
MFAALHRPLYMIGCGELGTTPHELDQSLSKIFKLAPIWNAVLLIDEADVFLEKRADQNIMRNAMVAVFLRNIECVPSFL